MSRGSRSSVAVRPCRGPEVLGVQARGRVTLATALPLRREDTHARLKSVASRAGQLARLEGAHERGLLEALERLCRLEPRPQRDCRRRVEIEAPAEGGTAGQHSRVAVVELVPGEGERAA